MDGEVDLSSVLLFEGPYWGWRLHAQAENIFITKAALVEETRGKSKENVKRQLPQNYISN